MHPELKAHPAYFEKEVVQLADNVYQAFGFAASNVYMIIGDDGLIIVDTSETTVAAENILAEFRKITDLPIKTIILTHSHRDHVSGASIFAEGGNPEILASTRFSEDSLFVASDHPQPAKGDAGPHEAAVWHRIYRIPDEIIGIGVGPGERPLKGMGAGALPPTRRIGDEGEKLSIHGIDLELVHAPGETPDHIVVWYADKKVLICGDNFYRSFPNLYPPRGTAYRDFDSWADTMDLLDGFWTRGAWPGPHKSGIWCGENQE